MCRQIILAANQTDSKELLKRKTCSDELTCLPMNYTCGGCGSKVWSRLGLDSNLWLCQFSTANSSAAWPAQPSHRLNVPKMLTLHRCDQMVHHSSTGRPHNLIPEKYLNFVSCLTLEVIYAPASQWVYWQGGDFPFPWVCHG